MTTESGWAPSEPDVRQGQEAYLRYAGGVGIINDPHTDFAQGMLGEGREASEHPVCALITAEELMYANLVKLAKAANPPELRGATGRLEHRYGSALPHIISIIDRVFENDTMLMRLDRINPALLVMRPSPLEDEAVYKALCHGRRHKLYTSRLLDGVGAAAEFTDLLEGRTLGNTKTAATRRQLTAGQ